MFVLRGGVGAGPGAGSVNDRAFGADPMVAESAVPEISVSIGPTSTFVAAFADSREASSALFGSHIPVKDWSKTFEDPNKPESGSGRISSSVKKKICYFCV